MNPIIPFQSHCNSFLKESENKKTPCRASANAQSRPLFPNRSMYGPLIPSARANAQGAIANLKSCGQVSCQKRAMRSLEKVDIRPNPTNQPRSNLPALLAQSDANTIGQAGAGASAGAGAMRFESNTTDLGRHGYNQVDVALVAEKATIGQAPRFDKLRRPGTPPSALPSFIPPKKTWNEEQPNTQTRSRNDSFIRMDTRKCLSSKDLTYQLAPASGSPYAFMLYQKEMIESQMAERLHQTRKNSMQQDMNQEVSNYYYAPKIPGNESCSGSSRGVRLTNEARNKRRAEHNRAVRNDLCEIVTDLFVAESKLLNPSKYGVDTNNVQREKVYECVQRFINALPARYALGAETPSEVLLHMRLMQAVRLDPARPTVHIAKLEGDRYWSSNPTVAPGRSLMLVTISCADAVGLLEYISKILASGSSRVLDADVMLSSDNIVLDRFVVEMNGRLRLDRLAAYIEKFLEKSRKTKPDNKKQPSSSNSVSGGSSDTSSNSKGEMSGSLYYQPSYGDVSTIKDVEEEIKAAMPLSALIAGQGTANEVGMLQVDNRFLPLSRNLSLPPNFRPAAQHISSKNDTVVNNIEAADDNTTSNHVCKSGSEQAKAKPTEVNEDYSEPVGIRVRRPLVNRQGNSDLDNIYQSDDDDNNNNDNTPPINYIKLNGARPEIESRNIPFISFDELMLIETLGMGRVSTIYRAAWSKPVLNSYPGHLETSMLALKVAMVNPKTLDTTHVDELRREADIAARLSHPNICSLEGVAADSDCFCLAYEFCEGGSLLSLLSDSSRYYEYLPIALDVANGMAYLHSRNVIHRDLKPSNILLTRDNRAKIADFGMSVTHTGQELTAETGTYRYMAPEVIRHESYSSNADVYSFGICLWQLITREIPFAGMTPIQAAYAVAEGRRPRIPENTPSRLREIILACWEQDSRKRPSFTYIAMALADYVKMAFSPANVGTQTLNIANEMLANVEGNSTVNVDFSAPVLMGTYIMYPEPGNEDSSSIGLEI